jgi:hypothetical protein
MFIKKCNDLKKIDLPFLDIHSRAWILLAFAGRFLFYVRKRVKNIYSLPETQMRFF